MKLRFAGRSFLLAVLLPVIASAANTGMPWEPAMQRVAKSLGGPTLAAGAVMLLAMIAVQHAHHGEFSEVSRRFGATVLWLGIGFGGALVIAGLFFTIGARV